MAGKQSRAQKATVARVMHEYKHGELESAGGEVKNPKQAVAIALSEAGASSRQSDAENKARLRHTQGKERRGETAMQEAEGKGAMRAKEPAAGSRIKDRSESAGGGRSRPSAGGGDSGQSKAALYAEAKRRNIAGRARMSKAELANALQA